LRSAVNASFSRKSAKINHLQPLMLLTQGFLHGPSRKNLGLARGKAFAKKSQAEQQLAFLSRNK